MFRRLRVAQPSPFVAIDQFAPAEAAEMVATAVTFHYVHRLVNVLLVKTNLPANPIVKDRVKRVLGWIYGKTAPNLSANAARLPKCAPVPVGKPGVHLCMANCKMLNDFAFRQVYSAKTRSERKLDDGSTTVLLLDTNVELRFVNPTQLSATDDLAG